MTTKHTPGPWHIFRRWAGYTGLVIRADQTDLADLRINGHNAEHGEANARLIAASPDMLEALQAAIVDLEVVASNLSDEPNRQDPQECAEVCAKIAADFRALVIKVTAPYRARF